MRETSSGRLYGQSSKKRHTQTYYIDTIKGNKGDSIMRSAMYVRLLLIYLSTASLMTCVVTAYNIPINIQLVLLITAVCVGFFYYALMKLRKLAIFIGVVIAGALTYFTGFFARIVQAGVYVYNFLLYNMNNGILSTRRYMTIDQKYFTAAVVESNVALEYFLVTISLLIILLSFIFTVALNKKIRLLPCAFLSLAFISPAILASLMPALAAFALMLSVYIGLYSVKVSAFTLTKSGHKKKQNAVKVMATAQGSLLEKKRSSAKRYLLRHANHGTSALLCAFICALSFLLSSLVIPNNTYLKFDDVITQASDYIMSIRGVAQEQFDFASNSNQIFPTTFGFGGLNKTNLLSLSSPSLSEREVLRVSTESSTQVFLRASIGVDFEDNRWTEISQEQDDAYRELLERGFVTEESAYRFYQMNFTQRRMENDSLLESTGFRQHQINVEHLTQSRMMFFPVSIHGANMMDNDLFTTYGDTTATLKENSQDVRLEMSAVIPSSTLLKFRNAYYNKINNYLQARDDVIDYYENNEDGIYNSILFEMQDEDSNDGMIEQLHLEGLYAQQVREYYMGIPEEMKEEITPLAQSVTENGNTNYDKVMALYTYLKEGYSYSLEPQETPSGYDDVRQFLFVSKQGHCSLYASAMVLMARAIGLPARYAVGFSANTRENTTPDGEYYAILQEKDYHAWAEIYFDGLGWVPFDPTGIYDVDSSDLAYSVATTSSTTMTTQTTPPNQSTQPPNTTTSTPPEQAKSLKNIGQLFAVVALAILSGAGIVAFGNRKQRRKHQRFCAMPTTPATQAIYYYILKMLATAKYQPQAGESPHEFARRVDKELYMQKEQLNMSILMSLFERCEFASENVPISEQERRLAYDYMQMLYHKIVEQKPVPIRIYRKWIL